MPTIGVQSSAFSGVHIPSSDVIANCLHCGLCLPTCPTYALTGIETSSPRGRIRLIKSVAEGELQITPMFAEEMDFCLDCCACETACPAGVKYGHLVEHARAQIFEQRKESLTRRLLKRILLGWFFESQHRLRKLALVLRWYQVSGIERIVRQLGILKFFSRRLNKIQLLAPRISHSFTGESVPERILPKGTVKHRVGFVTGCLMDIAFDVVNKDTIQLLLHHDCEVIVPRNQSCCGSLQAHNGDLSAARKMASNLIRAFEKTGVDYIVMNSAGCGAFAKEYKYQLAGDPEVQAGAKEFSEKILDITEFMDIIGYRPIGLAKPLKVTYHDACHLAHSQHITNQPRRLIKSIPGVEFIELPESTWCCGSAGIYNVVRYDDAKMLLDRKIENIEAITPQVIVSGNPGCLLQIEHGLKERGLQFRLLHTSSFLREACGI